MRNLQTARTSRDTNNLEMKVSNILSIDTMPRYCCAGECVNSVTRVTNAKQYEMTLGGESTGGDLVVARWLLVASLLVASLSGGEVTINL